MGNFASRNDISDLQTQIERAKYQLPPDAENFVKKTDLNNFFTKVQSDDKYVGNTSFNDFKGSQDLKFTNIDNNLNQNFVKKTDLTNYFTKSETDTKVNNINTNLNGNFVKKTDLTNYFTKSETDTKLTNINTNLNSDVNKVNTFLKTFSEAVSNNANSQMDCSYNPSNDVSWSSIYDQRTTQYIDSLETDLKAPFCTIKGNCWRPNAGGGAWCYKPMPPKPPAPSQTQTSPAGPPQTGNNVRPPPSQTQTPGPGR